MSGPRLTIQTQALLGALLEAETEMYGLEMIRTSGLAAGTVYPILQRLLAAGWISARWEPDEAAQAEGRPSRRYYELSAQGRTRAINALTGSSARRGSLARLLDLPQPGTSAEGS